MKQLCVLLLLSSLLISCSNNSGQLVDKTETPESSPSESNSIASNPSTSNSTLPQGHPPINEMNRQAMEVREQPNTAAPQTTIEGTTAKIAGLSFTIAPEWQSTPPSSMMRAAQFTVPAAEGDSEAGELVLFQGIGGSAQMNIDRWVGQFSNQSGAPESGQKDIGTLKIYTVDINGTYSASMGPMMAAQTVTKTDYRMLAAVVEGADGPWHFKLTGPKATLEKWKPAFMQLIDSLKPAN